VFHNACTFYGILIIGIKGFLGRYLSKLAIARKGPVHGLDISDFPAVTDRKLPSVRLGIYSAEVSQGFRPG